MRPEEQHHRTAFHVRHRRAEMFARVERRGGLAFEAEQVDVLLNATANRRLAVAMSCWRKKITPLARWPAATIALPSVSIAAPSAVCR